MNFKSNQMIWFIKLICFLIIWNISKTNRGRAIFEEVLENCNVGDGWRNHIWEPAKTYEMLIIIFTPTDKHFMQSNTSFIRTWNIKRWKKINKNVHYGLVNICLSSVAKSLFHASKITEAAQMVILFKWGMTE